MAAPTTGGTWDPRGFTVTRGNGGYWHIWPNGRKVFVKDTAGKPAAASAATAATNPDAQAPLGPDAQYTQQMLALARQRDDAITGLQTQRRQTMLNTGYSGQPGSLTFDPTDPYSKAAMLKQTYERHRRSTGQQLGAGGQLYSGAYLNAQNQISRDQLQGEDALQKSLVSYLAQNDAGQASATTNYDLGVNQAWSDRLNRAVNSR
jgi:hypothetical protein